jgi:signal transduction histidine kinase
VQETAGKIQWSMAPLDLAELVNKMARQYAPLAAQQGLKFKAEVETNLPRILGDGDRLEQVVNNLLTNALKFTPRGSITLRARRTRDEVHLEVADTGIGIAETDQQAIFEKFQQVGPILTSKPHGTGLGFAISREIVTHRRGRICITSRPGAGSTFAVALPIATESITSAA